MSNQTMLVATIGYWFNMALFKVCKTNNFNLKWYDYNELYKEKDDR